MVQCPEDMEQYTIFQEDKDMRNWKKVLLAVVPAAMMFSFTAFAGQWHQDMNGWWYENEDGSTARTAGSGWMEMRTARQSAIASITMVMLSFPFIT